MATTYQSPTGTGRVTSVVPSMPLSAQTAATYSMTGITLEPPVPLPQTTYGSTTQTSYST